MSLLLVYFDGYNNVLLLKILNAGLLLVHSYLCTEHFFTTAGNKALIQ